ncbi:hypothetical protein [Brevundimonas diminuta]|uniref:hypothetical protein n=1 Tax=Brevundimonas diminuta TaxID=293 RepID=UPI003D9AA627
MRILPVAAIGVLILAGCSPTRAESAPGAAGSEGSSAAPRVTSQETSATATAPDAVFERDEPAPATMTLDREGRVWRVAFRAGGLPNGPATAADCELQAVGAQDFDDVIAARVAPFEGELNAITDVDIGAAPPFIEVRVGPEGVFVRDRGAAVRFCAMGSDIDGFYRRTGSPD